MERTMIFDEYDTPFLGGTGTPIAGHGRFAFTAGWIGVTPEVRSIATLIGDGPGSSVPIGRRLRT